MAETSFLSALLAEITEPTAKFEGVDDISPELKRIIENPAPSRRRVLLGDAMVKYRPEIEASRREALARVFARLTP